MQALRKFIEQKNHWNSFFNGEQYEIATAKGRQRVADMIDSCLSPENLTCDGEVRGKALQDKQRFLFRCAEELISIDPTVSFYELSI